MFRDSTGKLSFGRISSAVILILVFIIVLGSMVFPSYDFLKAATLIEKTFPPALYMICGLYGLNKVTGRWK